MFSRMSDCNCSNKEWVIGHKLLDGKNDYYLYEKQNKKVKETIDRIMEQAEEEVTPHVESWLDWQCRVKEHVDTWKMLGSMLGEEMAKKNQNEEVSLNNKKVDESNYTKSKELPNGYERGLYWHQEFCVVFLIKQFLSLEQGNELFRFLRDSAESV